MNSNGFLLFNNVEIENEQNIETGLKLKYLLKFSRGLGNIS